MREQLFIKGVEIPLSKSLNPSITKEIADIKDPKSRKSEYTKSVTIPNSKEAAKVLGMIFEINAVSSSFNPTVKADVLYLVDGAEVLNGYMQLKEVVKTNNYDVEYKAVLFGSFANFFKEIEGKRLDEITGLETYDHILFRDIQNMSSGNNGEPYQIIEGGATVPAELGKGYIYALVDYGFSTDGTTFNVTDIGCSIYAQEYWDRVWADSGFTYEFTDTDFADHFKHLIVPASPQSFLLDSSEIALRVFGANTPLLTSTGTITSNNLTKGSFTANDIIKFSNEVYDDGGTYNPSNGTWTCPDSGLYNFQSTFAVFATFKPTDTINSITSVGYIALIAKLIFYDASTGLETVQEEYEFRIQFQGATIGNRTTAATPTESDTNYYVIEYIMGVPYTVSTGKSQPNLVQIGFTDKAMSTGDKVYAVWSANYDTDSAGYFVKSGGIPVYSDGEADITIEVGSFSNKVSNVPALEGNVFKVNKCIPKVSQTDFIQNYVKEYNLYLEQDPNKTNHFLIAPRDSFYNNDVIDLTGKVSIDKGIVYKPVGALDANNYLYKHKDDKDYLNDKYLNTWQETYGQREIEDISEFGTKIKKTEVSASPTPLADNGTGNNRVLSTIVQVDELGQKVSTSSNWRTLYYGGLKDNDQVWQHRTVDGAKFPQTQYPYAGHFDDPFNPTLDINFGLVRQVYYTDLYHPITVTDNNLYNKYHSKLIREITDRDSKIVEAFVNMSPSNFKEWSFRNLYYFDNAYFRLNKINSFNPTSNELTKCEFLKLKEVSPFEPTLIGLDGDGVPFNPDYGGDGGGVIGQEYVPLLGISQSPNQDNNNYRSASGSVSGENNLISIDAHNVKIQGDNNKVFSKANGITLENSSGNTINAGLQNVTLINTDGVTVTESNVTYVNGIIKYDGSNGCMDYNDTSTTQQGLQIQSNTWTDIPNDGLGVDTNKANKPQHVTELLDVTTGYLDFSELNIGDAVVIRNDFIIRPQSNNVKAEFRYVVANSTTYYLHKTFPRLDSGSGVDYEINLSTDYIYIGNEQTRDAAIQMQIRLSANGRLYNTGTAIQVIAK